MTQSKIRTIKRGGINLKGTKKRLQGGNPKQMYSNYIYLTEEEKIKFKVSDVNFKRNILKTKHKNLEVFEHQQKFMNDLLNKYSKEQVFEKKGNFFTNSGPDTKVFFNNQNGNNRDSLFRLEENHNSDFTKLVECLYIETNVNNQIFFKIVFKKSEISDLIAPFIILIYPKNGRLMIYLHTLIRELKVPEHIKLIAQDESSLYFGGDYVVPDGLKNLVQVDLIKKISWKEHQLSEKTTYKESKEIANCLLNNSGWLGTDANRTLKIEDEEGTDTMIKRTLRNMSQSWDLEYLTFPTSNQDPYYRAIGLNGRNAEQLIHLTDILILNRLLIPYPLGAPPIQGGNPWNIHVFQTQYTRGDLCIREDVVDTIIGYINNTVPPRTNKRLNLRVNPIVVPVPTFPIHNSADPDIYNMHPDHKQSLIDTLKGYRNLIGSTVDINGVIYLQPIQLGLTLYNPWVYVLNKVETLGERAHLIGFNDLKKQTAPNAAGLGDILPRKTPTKNNFISSTNVNMGAPGGAPGVPLLGRILPDDYNKWAAICEQGSIASYRHYYKQLVKPQISTVDLNRKEQTESIPLVSADDPPTVQGNPNATFYDVVSDPDQKFFIDHINGDLYNQPTRLLVSSYIKRSTKDNVEERVGLKPFIDIKENPRNRIDIGVGNKWDQYVPKQASYLWSGVMTRVEDRNTCPNRTISLEPSWPNHAGTGAYYSALYGPIQRGDITTSDLGGIHRIPQIGEKVNPYYAERPNYLNTLLDFKKIIEGFYKKDDSYFLFPHVQGFISLKQVMDLKLFSPCDVQDNSPVVSITVSNTTPDFNQFEIPPSGTPDLNIVPDLFHGGKASYGISKEGPQEHEIVETDYTYVLNERYVLGGFLDDLKVGDENNQITVGNLLGEVMITGSNTEGQHELTKDIEDTPVLSNPNYKILTHLYKLNIQNKHQLRASDILVTIFDKIGLENESMILQCPNKLNFLFVVYLLIKNKSVFEGKIPELNNFFDFYQKEVFDTSTRVRRTDNNTLLSSLNNHLKNFKGILKDVNHLNYDKLIRVPSYNSINFIDIYKIDKENTFLKVLFDTILRYRKNENINFGLDITRNPGSLRLMELLNKYEENEELQASEILNELRVIDNRIFNLFDSVGNLKGREFIKPMCEYLSIHFEVPIYTIIKKDEYSTIENYGVNSLYREDKLPLVLFLSDNNNLILGNEFEFDSENIDDPNIFYESKTYEEISSYDFLDVDNRKDEFKMIFDKLDSDLVSKVNISTSLNDLNFKGSGGNHNIVITGASKFEIMKDNIDIASLETIIRGVLDKVLKIRDININIPTGSKPLRYLIDGDSQSDIYQFSPYSVDKHKWKKIYKDMFQALDHSSCYLNLKYTVTVGGHNKDILIIFLKRCSSYSQETIVEYIDKIKESYLLKYDTNNYYNNIWIDEDSIRINNLLDNEKTKSSLLLNGLMLGYNKAIPEREFRRDPGAVIESLRIPNLNLETLFTLLCLEKSRYRMLNIFTKAISILDFKRLIKDSLSNHYLKFIKYLCKELYSLFKSGTSFLSSIFSMDKWIEMGKKAAIAAAAVAGGLSGAYHMTVEAPSVSGVLKMWEFIGVNLSSVVSSSFLWQALGLYLCSKFLYDIAKKTIAESGLFLLLLLNMLDENNDFKNASSDQEKIAAINAFIISIRKTDTSFTGVTCRFNSLDDLLYVLNKEKTGIITDTHVEDALSNTSLNNIVNRYTVENSINIVTNSCTRSLKSLKNILSSDENNNFSDIDLLYHIYIQLLEGDNKSRFIGKKVKFIKDEIFSIPTMGLTGNILEYDSNRAEFKIKIDLSWGSEALVYYCNNMIQITTGDDEMNWSIIKVIAEECKEYSLEHKSENSQQVFFEVLKDGSIDEKVKEVIKSFLHKPGISITLATPQHKCISEAVKMFSDTEFIVNIQNRSSIRLLSDKSKVIGGGLNLRSLIKMLDDDKNVDIGYKLLIDRINRISSTKIFLLYTSVLGRVHNVYPDFNKDDKDRNKEEVKFIVINEDNNRKMSAFTCSKSLYVIIERLQQKMLKKPILKLDDNINVGHDYFVFDGNKVTDKVTVRSMVDSATNVLGQEKSYMVDSNINPGTQYVVNSSNLILESDFEYNTDKFMYPSEVSTKRGSKDPTRTILDKKEVEREINIGIFEKINSMFDKFTTVFDSVDTLFSKSLLSSDSKTFLNDFISNSLVTLDSLRSVVLNSKLSKIYYVKLLNIESRIHKFYNKHSDILEEEEDIEDLDNEDGENNKELINDEDDYQGIIMLRFEQSKKLPTKEFKKKIDSLKTISSKDIKVSKSLMNLYKMVCDYIELYNVLTLGDYKSKQKAEDQRLVSFYSLRDPFRSIEISELVKPSTGNFFFTFFQSMIDTLNKYIEKFKDHEDNKKNLEDSKKELENLCKSIEAINPQVKYIQEKKKNENKDKKDDDKLIKFRDFFKEVNKTTKKEMEMEATSDMQVKKGNNWEDLDTGGKIKFKIEGTREFVDPKEWKTWLTKEVFGITKKSKNKDEFSMTQSHTVNKVKFQIKCFDESNTLISKIKERGS